MPDDTPPISEAESSGDASTAATDDAGANGDTGPDGAAESDSTNLDTDGPNWWQRRYRLGDTLLRVSALLFGIGLGILFANGPVVPGVAFSERVIDAGEFLFIVAIGVVVFAAVVMAASLLGHLAARRDLLPAELSVPRPW
jgi:hypothetical protein